MSEPELRKVIREAIQPTRTHGEAIDAIAAALAPLIEARVREARADELLLVAAEFESNANRVVKAKGETERTGYAYEVVEVLRNRAEKVRRNA